MKFIDLSGKQFNSWTVLECVGRKGYRCRCKCGTVRVVQRGNLTHGCSRSCRQCSEFAVEIHNKLPEREAAFNDLYGRYVRGAKLRGLDFDLPKPLAKMIFRMPCNYCGDAPNSAWPTDKQSKHLRVNGRFVYSGIDRVDSSVGYISTNVVPCCMQCNVAKRCFSEEEFVERSKRIAKMWEAM
jgi:hypothetical protein